MLHFSHTCPGVATGTLVPSTSEDKPPTPVPFMTPPTGSEEAYDPHDYDEVAMEEAAARRATGGQGNGLPSVVRTYVTTVLNSGTSEQGTQRVCPL